MKHNYQQVSKKGVSIKQPIINFLLEAHIDSIILL